MLTEMLKKNPTFQNLSEEEQVVFARLAYAFEADSRNLYRSPEELQYSTGVGNSRQWATFLNLEPTVSFIKTQIAQITDVMTRKSLLNLQLEAETGNVQAIKQIHEISGILQQEDTNRIVVLHQIKRPEPKKEAVQNV